MSIYLINVKSFLRMNSLQLYHISDWRTYIFIMGVSEGHFKYLSVAFPASWKLLVPRDKNMGKNRHIVGIFLWFDLGEEQSLSISFVHSFRILQLNEQKFQGVVVEIWNHFRCGIVYQIVRFIGVFVNYRYICT